ncbi:MAG: hypothetical protein ABI571_02230, partial [Actinomycetota bacterium]
IHMPLTFVDGSTAEAIAPLRLGIQDMPASIYTSAGLGGVDRTLNFRYVDGSTFMHEGPLGTYEGVDGTTVELWQPNPDLLAECPNLVFRFGDWFVGVRTCQRELSESEKGDWARLLSGEVTDGGFLVLSAEGRLKLQETGGHEGPQLILGKARSNWIQLRPGECDPEGYTGEDIRIMPDGTRVSFSRIPHSNGIEYDWFVNWCEDGLMTVQVEYAYKDFAEATAEGFRINDTVLAP